jgi:PAS domain S-box-containing protein
MRLESIVASAMEAIITVDRSQVVVLFNRTAGTIFGVAPEDAIGQPLDRFIPARQREIHRERVAQFARDARTDRRMGRLGELTGLRANGEEFPIEASISRSGEGERQLLTVVLRDVTEQRQTEQAQRAQQVAEAASRAKSTFLANMSHELRTPLSAVLGLSQLMQADRSEPLGERQAVRAEQIRTAGTHLLALINDALDLARIEAGGLQIAIEAVDLVAVLRDALALCHALAGRHRVAVHALAPDTAPLWVQGDALRVRQVLINLLSNAIKYSHPGGEVVLRLEPQAAWGVLEIEDHGLGMTAQQLAHLYEPFNRLGRDARSIEGTGIGLVLTRQLVEGMAGRLEIRSEAGQGTCVRVELPRVDAATRVDPAPAAPEAAESATIEPAGLVLYIEDNPVNVAVVEGLLSHWDGVSVASAARGQLGIEMARRLLPGLVLLDMGLPDLDGVAVLTALRQDPRTAGLPVVMLSASAQPDEVARAMQAGAVEYLGKPVDFQRLAATVARLLPPATSMPAPVADPG